LKKVLGLMLLMVLGLGLVVWAVAPLSGDVSLTLTLDPSATTFAGYIGLDAGLGIAYAIGGWTFTSTSGFSSDGWDEQSFGAEGLLGAFSGSATVNFLPYALLSTTSTVTHAGTYDDFGTQSIIPIDLVTWTVTHTDVLAYGVAFDDLTVTGGVSIAGVSFEAEFFMEHWEGDATIVTTPIYWYESSGTPPTGALLDADVPTAEYMVQTGSLTVTTPGDTVAGAGWLFTVAGSFGNVTLTSYTYFNLQPTDLIELDISDSFSFDLTDYTVVEADQVVRFSHEVLVLEGLTLGCIEADAYLWISCCAGFEHLFLHFTDVPVICCGITTDFAIDFSLQNKYVQLYPSIAGDWLCWTPTLSLNWDGTSVIDGITLDAIEVEVALNGITFSSKTTFGSYMDTIDSGNTTDYFFFVPSLPATVGAIPSVLDDGSGFYEVYEVNVANDYYETFEYFKVEIDGDSCCGGAFDVTVQTWFGQHFTADLAEFGYWYETNMTDAGVPGTGMDHGQGFYFDNVAGVVYHYDEDIALAWYPGCGFIAVNVTDVAYADLLGVDGVPVVYTAATAVETLVTAETTVATATTGRLFEWAKTAVDASVGIGANFSLTFSLAIDAYGWDSAGFGFEYTF